MNKYYVYLHRHPQTMEVVYVGKGVNGRAWDVTRCRGQHKEHQTWMQSLIEEGYIPSDWVIIHAKNLSEQDAYKLERSYLYDNGTLRFNRQSGERNYQAKLTDAQAIEIYLAKEQHKVLAERYGVSRSAISMIKTRKQWRAVTACCIQN